MNKRLAGSLVAFAVLAVVASYLLHGKVLAVVLILYGYFAVRTVIADKLKSQNDSLRDESSQAELSSDSEAAHR